MQHSCQARNYTVCHLFLLLANIESDVGMLVCEKSRQEITGKAVNPH